MKIAKIMCREVDYPDYPINKDYIVEYTDDFDNKCEALERFQSAMLNYNFDDDEEISAEDMELLNKYYLDENGEGGSTIEAIELYIADHFNIIETTDEFLVEW